MANRLQGKKALVTAAGRWDRVAAWLPHSVIVPLAVGQGLLLLARRSLPHDSVTGPGAQRLRDAAR